jgi:hypothetical protein
MRSRAFRVAMLVFQAVWLNAILPGHTRGIVTLPGAADDCASCASVAPRAAGGCCATEGGDGRAPREKDPVPPGRAGRCAICHFAARLTIPPVVDLRPPALEPAAVRPAQLSLRCVALRFPPPYDACGPPAAV